MTEGTTEAPRAPETWLDFCQRMHREHGADGVEGADAARREIELARWTRETAQKYLASVGPTTSPYARGYDAAVRWFAEVSCGGSPASPERAPW